LTRKSDFTTRKALLRVFVEEVRIDGRDAIFPPSVSRRPRFDNRPGWWTQLPLSRTNWRARSQRLGSF
jgi:hypothetical protein